MALADVIRVSNERGAMPACLLQADVIFAQAIKTIHKLRKQLLM